MRRTALLVAALAVASSPPAHATPEPLPGPYTGCSYDVTVVDPDDPSRVRGVLHGNVAVADLADPGADPAAVTLTCSLQSAGSYDPSQPDDFTVSASGDGVAVVPPTPFSVPAPPADEGPIAVCSRADVTDAGGTTTTYYFNSQNSTWITGSWATCAGAATCLELGPDCVWFLALLWDLVERADGELCPVLASLAPGVPGVVDIDPTGDTYVVGVWAWDCPPYGS